MNEGHPDRRAVSPAARSVSVPVTALLLAAGIGQISHEAAAEVTAVGSEGFDNLSKAVDGVLGEQVARLHSFIETGAPDSARR